MIKNKPENYLGKPLALLILTFLTIGMIESCKKDLKTQNGNPNPIISLAKTWYESAYPAYNNKLNTQSTTNETDLSQLIKPDWQHGASYSRFNKNVIELPLDPSSKFSSAIKNASINVASNKAYSKNSFILINNSTGYDAYIMTLIADSSYLKNDLSKLAKNTYNKRDTDYSGLVLYFTPKGRYVCGWRYKNGKLVLPQNQQTNVKVESTGNFKLKPLNVEPECWDYYLVGYSNGVEDSREYLFTSCTGGGDGGSSSDGSGSGSVGGSSGGGGGGGGANSPTPPQPCTGPFPKTNSIGGLTTNRVPPDPVDPGDGTGFPPPTTTTCTVETITNNVVNPCLHNMVNATISSGVTNQINTLIQSIFGGSTKVNLNFTDSSTLPNYADGYTPPNTGIVNGVMDAQIQLNVNNLPNYSQEYIARVIMHESLHAYMDSQGIVADLQHESMFINYVTQMAASLQQMFPGLDDTDAKNLALGGLQPADTFQNTIAKDMGLLGTFDATNLAYSVGPKGTRCH